MSSASKIEISTDLLRTLHRIHRQRADLKSRLERGPRQIKAGETMVAAAAEKVDAAKKAVKAAKLVADEKQLQLSTRESRINDLQGKLNTAASNREYSMLKEQIAADEQANLVLSDEVFEALERIDTLNAEADAAEAELTRQNAEQVARIADVNEKMKVVQSDLDNVETQLKNAEAAVPAAARADYKRLTDARGEEALAPVEDESCGGCYQTLTMQHLETLRMSLLSRCPNCNAFLYFPENLRP